MAYLTTAPRGTKDILPGETPKWQYLEKTLLETAELFGFREIRIPTFEHTELFTRSVGDTTDVVQKEMYTFTDKGERSITLRPEGTAGGARAALENGLLGDALPLKVSYDITCFRYEKPGSGRFREFHQFGVELYGAASPAADSEVLALAYECLTVLGLQNVVLELNSLGCPECRKKYTQALLAYFESHRERLCATCLERLEKNPLRVLDCKNPEDQKIAAGAPSILDYLCGDCQNHFQEVQDRLTAAEIPFRAFYRCHSLAQVCFPPGLKRIGKEAFAFCRELREVRLAEGVAVEERAFAGCKSEAGANVESMPEERAVAEERANGELALDESANVESVVAEERVKVELASEAGANGEHAFAACPVPDGGTDGGSL